MILSLWLDSLMKFAPILMDFEFIGGVPPRSAPASQLDPGNLAHEPARQAMGDTPRYADRPDLLAVRPLGHLSSTGYLLAEPGKETLTPSGRVSEAKVVLLTRNDE